jgi:hypothetical protein
LIVVVVVVMMLTMAVIFSMMTAAVVAFAPEVFKKVLQRIHIGFRLSDC